MEGLKIVARMKKTILFKDTLWTCKSLKDYFDKKYAPAMSR